MKATTDPNTAGVGAPGQELSDDDLETVVGGLYRAYTFLPGEEAIAPESAPAIVFSGVVRKPTAGQLALRP